MKKFTLTGVAGYIAPRHMKAIKDTGNELLAALDPYDGIGIMDSNFPEASFFTEFERFDRHIDKLKREGHQIDYVSITTPNYLYDAHMRWALRSGVDAICEKPLVLNPWNIDALKVIEQETGQRTYKSITVDGEEIEFSSGFTELHTRSYEEILKGNGFGIDEAYGSIETVSTIRNLNPVGLKGEWHPFCIKVKNID